MEEWILGNLTDRKIGYGIVQPGKALQSGVPVIKVNNIISGLNNVDDLEKTSIENDYKYKRTKLEGGELIISVVGTIGKTAIVPISFKGCNLVRATALIDIKDPVLTKWVKYYIDSPSGQNYIKSNLNTTVQATLNIKSLAEMPIPKYERDKIERIVSTLSSIDEKIEVNRKINENLEQQTQALFKSWFVDFEPFKEGKFVDSELGMIPEGWEVVSFKDFTNVLNGGTPKTTIDKYWNGDIPFFTPKDVKTSCFCLNTEKNITEKGLNACSSKLYPKGTVFITARGTVGKVCMAGRDMAMNQSCYALRAKDEKLQMFVYLQTLNILQQIKKKSNGAVFSAITARDFDENIILPKSEIIVSFEKPIRSIYEQILSLQKENERLSSLRDTLLPKLMSGEIEL